MKTDVDQTLVDLLGQTRRQVVEMLRGAALTVAEMAGELGLTEGAVRRHLQALERDGLVTATTVRRDGPGRPSSSYTLTERGRRLFPDRSAELASDLLDYLEQEHGRPALLGFLRWRQREQGRRYALELERAPDLGSKAELLAELLTEDGFPSRVEAASVPDGATVLELRQEHCAIQDVAEEHPELCAYEAALFKQVLGANIKRRQTMAAGAPTCVCHIRLPAGGAASEDAAEQS